MKTKSGIINLILLAFFFSIGLNATPNTDLLEAAQNSDLPKLESALAVGADINYADSENRTALYFAYMEDKIEIISYLKKNGAKETNLAKLFRIDRNCLKKYISQDYKAVIKEAKAIQEEKIQYSKLFQKEDKSPSLEQNSFLNIIYYRALAYTLLKEYKLAFKDYEQILNRYKTSNVHLHYADSLEKAGNRKKAIQILESSLLYYSGYDKAKIYHDLGWYYYLENQIDKAIYCGEESFKLVKNNVDLLGSYFNISVYKFRKGDYESGWNWFFYSINLSFRMDLTTRRNQLAFVIVDFENLQKKQNEIKSKTLEVNVKTALWFLNKAKEEPVPNSLNLRKSLPVTKIKRAIFENPFLGKKNSGLNYIVAAYFSKMKNFTEADISLESACKEGGYSLYEKSKKEEDFQYYHEKLKENQKGFYQREEAAVRKVQMVIQNGHSRSVKSVAFSRNGKKILSGSEDNTVKLWNSLGKLLHTFEGHSNVVSSVAFSPDGKKIVSGSRDDTIKLWDISGKLLHTFEGHANTFGFDTIVNFSPDGNQILSVYGDTIRLWELSGKLVKSFNGNSGKVNSIAFSPNGKQILVASDDYTMRLWDRSGKLLQTFKGHSGFVQSVSFSFDGQKILSGSDDKKIKLWDVSGRELQTFQGHFGKVSSVAFSPDGMQIISGSEDKTIKLWDISGKVLYTFEGHSGDVNSIAFSSNGKQIVSGSEDDTIKLWDISEKKVYTFEGHSHFILNVAFSPDGKKILSGADQKIKLWDSTGKLLHTFEGHSHLVSSIAFSPDGKKIISGSRDKTIKLWDLSGKLIHTFIGFSHNVSSVAFSPDSKLILSGSGDDTIHLWYISGKVLYTFEGQKTYFGYNTSVAFSPDGNFILSGYGKTIKLWELSGKIVNIFKGHSDKVTSVAFSPDGKQILSGSVDNTLKLWDISGKLLHTFSGYFSVEKTSFSPDGKKILGYGDYDQSIKLWDINGKLLYAFEGHSGFVTNAIFSGDGKYFLSGSVDNTIKLWDVDKRALVATLIAFKDGEGLVYTPDGRFDYTDPKVKDYVSYRKGDEFIELSDIHDEKYTKGLLQLVLNGKLKVEDSSGFEKSFESPPKIKYQYPQETKKIASKDEYTEIGFEVSDTGQGIREVKVLVNGIPVNVPEDQLNSLKNGDTTNEFRVKLPLAAIADNRIEIKAYNNEGGVRSITVHLGRSSEGLIPKKPNLYLLSVGVGKYDKRPLTYTVKDATVLAETLKAKTKDLYEKQNVVILTDEKASRELILKELNTIVKESKPEDTVILYFSGHGSVANKRNGNSLYYYLPFGFDWNAKPKIERTATEQGLDMELLAKQIKSMFSRKVVIILDTCFSGSAADILAMTKDGGEELQAFKEQQEKLSNGTGRYFFASSAEDEVSREFAELGHGIFTKAFLNTLDDSAGDTDKDNHLSVLEVNNRLNQHFEILSKKYLKQETQSPICTPMGRDSFSSKRNDFPLVRTK